MTAVKPQDPITTVRTRIARAAEQVGRDPASITIVAASKTRSVEDLRPLAAQGIADMGENRLQELLEKRLSLPDLRWHLIGPLQRNKVRKAVGVAVLLHAIDRLDIARAVSSRALELGIAQPVLLQINLSGDPSKHGVGWREARATATQIAAMPGLLLSGLMGMPALGEDPEPLFRRLRDLRDDLGSGLSGLCELSMGMSEDLEAAVRAGATLVRPGSALFGPRPD